MTSKALVAAAVALLRPHLIGERADEPARVSEKLRQSTFWQGRGGAVEHAISGIDIALWDLMGKICGQPVSRLLGGCYRTRIKPYGSILFDEPPRLRETLRQTTARGFKAIKLGWRPFGRRDRAHRRTADPDGPRRRRAGRGADGGRRRQRAVLAARLQMGLGNGENAGRLRRGLVRGSAAAGRPGRLHRAAPPFAGADRDRRGADAAAELPAVPGTARRRHYPAGLYEMRRI